MLRCSFGRFLGVVWVQDAVSMLDLHATNNKVLFYGTKEGLGHEDKDEKKETNAAPLSPHTAVHYLLYTHKNNNNMHRKF